MPAIKLSNGYQMIPEGITVLKVSEATYDEDFGKVQIVLADKKNRTMRVNYRLFDEKGEANEMHLNDFSYLCKAALNDFERDEIGDINEIIGKFIRVEVVHTVSKSNGRTYANLRGRKEHADGFDGESVAQVSDDELAGLLDE